MRVYISDIVKINGAGLDIEFLESLEEFGSIDGEFRFEEPFSFKGTLTNVKSVLKLEGRLKINYTAKCCRCLKDINSQFDIKINEDFLNGSSEIGDDDGFYTYEGDYLEISKALRDNIILNLPMKHICHTNCKGLCSICGADLNKNKCNCEEEQLNPQMEILKNMFNN
jgi:uncharacterized protein